MTGTKTQSGYNGSSRGGIKKSQHSKAPRKQQPVKAHPNLPGPKAGRFPCLVEGCPETFHSLRDRQAHANEKFEDMDHASKYIYCRAPATNGGNGNGTVCAYSREGNRPDELRTHLRKYHESMLPLNVAGYHYIGLMHRRIARVYCNLAVSGREEPRPVGTDGQEFRGTAAAETELRDRRAKCDSRAATASAAPAGPGNGAESSTSGPQVGQLGHHQGPLSHGAPAGTGGDVDYRGPFTGPLFVEGPEGGPQQYVATPRANEEDEVTGSEEGHFEYPSPPGPYSLLWGPLAGSHEYPSPPDANNN